LYRTAPANGEPDRRILSDDGTAQRRWFRGVQERLRGETALGAAPDLARWWSCGATPGLLTGRDDPPLRRRPGPPHVTTRSPDREGRRGDCFSEERNNQMLRGREATIAGGILALDCAPFRTPEDREAVAPHESSGCIPPAKDVLLDILLFSTGERVLR